MAEEAQRSHKQMRSSLPQWISPQACRHVRLLGAYNFLWLGSPSQPLLHSLTVLEKLYVNLIIADREKSPLPLRCRKHFFTRIYLHHLGHFLLPSAAWAVGFLWQEVHCSLLFLYSFHSPLYISPVGEKENNKITLVAVFVLTSIVAIMTQSYKSIFSLGKWQLGIL